MNNSLEDELRAALRAAAANIDTTEPDHSPFDEGSMTRRESRLPNRRNWLGMAAIAAAVAVITGSALLLNRPDSADVPASANGFVVDGDIAVVDGVRLPIPGNAHVDTLTDTPQSIAVCIEQVRSSDCTDGVTVTVVRPDGMGHYPALPNPAMNPECQSVTVHDGQLADRPAQLTTFDCATTGVGSTAHTWYLADGSLSVAAGPGAPTVQVEQIVDGLDLTGWGNQR